MKRFMSNDQLVDLMKSRGIEITPRTSLALARESYYAIINGYKKPFLDTEAMKHNPDDVYRPGTSFDWIYDLFLFDRDLRSVTFNYISRAEAVMRTAVSQAFCESHPEPNAFLDHSNLCTPREYLMPKKSAADRTAQWDRSVSSLMRSLEPKARPTKGHLMNCKPFIRHYISKHGHVPLWVLVNDLTFGDIIKLYRLLKPNDRRRACRIVAGVSRWTSDQSRFLSERILLNRADTVRSFRNICAHDERLYCALPSSGGYRGLLDALRAFIPIEEVEELLGAILELLQQYGERLQHF